MAEMAAVYGARLASATRSTRGTSSGPQTTGRYEPEPAGKTDGFRAQTETLRLLVSTTTTAGQPNCT